MAVAEVAEFVQHFKQFTMCDKFCIITSGLGERKVDKCTAPSEGLFHQGSTEFCELVWILIFCVVYTKLNFVTGLVVYLEDKIWELETNLL